MWVSIRKNVGLGKSRAIFIKEFSIMGRSAGGGMEKVSIICIVFNQHSNISKIF